MVAGISLVISRIEGFFLLLVNYKGVHSVEM